LRWPFRSAATASCRIFARSSQSRYARRFSRRYASATRLENRPMRSLRTIVTANSSRCGSVIHRGLPGSRAEFDTLSLTQQGIYGHRLRVFCTALSCRTPLPFTCGNSMAATARAILIIGQPIVFVDACLVIDCVTAGTIGGIAR
jgi:hypothetical protein